MTNADSAPTIEKRKKKTPTSSSRPPQKQSQGENTSNGKKTRRGGKRKRSSTVEGQEKPEQNKSQDGNVSTGKKEQTKQHGESNGAKSKNAQMQKGKDTDVLHVGTDDDEEKINITKTMDHLSDVLFSSLDISAKSRRAIVDVLKYERMTHVQCETFSHILEGKDVLAKAKTGNGKTIAFLLPIIEKLVRDNRQSDSIPVVILSPTRELTNQIAAEAHRVAQFHELNIKSFVGGTSMKRDFQVLEGTKPLDILIATPGRLRDHINRNTGDITRKLAATSVLVLDEADRLLDMGFCKFIMDIISYLPKERQTLLFSATLPDSTEELKNMTLRPDHAFVDTINENEIQTNEQAVQKYITCELREIILIVETLIVEHMKKQDYKIMVFFPTARAAQFTAQLFSAAGFPGIMEMHSRKSQSYRTQTADAFRHGKKVIMFSSDVSARGVDYPDVSLVLQIGYTTREQYIHRIGRTARAGMAGCGILILADFEKNVLKTLSDLRLEETTKPDVNGADLRTGRVIANLKDNSELETIAQKSYKAMLGFYASVRSSLSISNNRVVEVGEEYSKSIGLAETPQLEKRVLAKMHLMGAKGIRPSPYVAGKDQGSGQRGRKR